VVRLQVAATAKVVTTKAVVTRVVITGIQFPVATGRNAIQLTCGGAIRAMLEGAAVILPVVPGEELIPHLTKEVQIAETQA